MLGAFCALGVNLLFVNAEGGLHDDMDAPTFRTHNMETEDCRLERHCLLTLRSGLEEPPLPVFLPFPMGDLCPAGHPRPALATERTPIKVRGKTTKPQQPEVVQKTGIEIPSWLVQEPVTYQPAVKAAPTTKQQQAPKVLQSIESKAPTASPAASASTHSRKEAEKPDPDLAALFKGRVYFPTEYEQAAEFFGMLIHDLNKIRDRVEGSWSDVAFSGDYDPRRRMLTAVAAVSTNWMGWRMISASGSTAGAIRPMGLARAVAMITPLVSAIQTETGRPEESRERMLAM